MKSITLRNDFHNTTATVRPRPDGTVSPGARDRALRRLCGVKGCTCGGLRGPQDAVVTDYKPEAGVWAFGWRIER